jgi:hypothetical protein
MTIEYIKSEDGKSILCDEKGLPMVRDGEREFALDAIHLFTKIPQLKEEAKQLRLDKEETMKKLDAFDGIEDAAAALAALETVKNLSDKKLIDAGEVEKVKASLKEDHDKVLAAKEKVYKEVLAQEQEKNFGLEKDLRAAVVSNAFAKSIHFSGAEGCTTFIDADMAEKYFGDFCRVEKDALDRPAVVVYDGLGKDASAVLSIEKAGDPASFDEAMLKIIEQYKPGIINSSEGPGGRGGKINRPGGKVIDKNDLSTIGSNLEDIAQGKVRVE